MQHLFIKIVLIATATLVYSSKATSNINSFKFELIARSNGHSTYELPQYSFLSNTNPVINAKGDVAFRFFDNTKMGIWLKKTDSITGKNIYTGTDEKMFSDPKINQNSNLSFTQFDDFGTDTIYTYNASNNSVEAITPHQESQLKYISDVQILSDKYIFYRGTDLHNQRNYSITYDFTKTSNSALNSTFKLKEGDKIDNQTISYLFRPAINENGDLAFKTRLSETGDYSENSADKIILKMRNHSKAITLAEDNQSNKDSKYVGFNNAIGLSENGNVVYIASHIDGAKRLIVYINEQTREVLTEGEYNIKSLELFTPKINNSGVIVFRAIGTNNKRGIYLLQSNKINSVPQLLIEEGQPINIDLGAAAITSHKDYPAFSGEIDINNLNQVVFTALVSTTEQNRSLGTAIFKTHIK